MPLEVLNMQSFWIMGDTQSWQPLQDLLFAPSTAKLVPVHSEFEATYPSQLYLSNETYEHNFLLHSGSVRSKAMAGLIFCSHSALRSKALADGNPLLLASYLEKGRGGFFLSQ